MSMTSSLDISAKYSNWSLLPRPEGANLFREIGQYQRFIWPSGHVFSIWIYFWKEQIRSFSSQERFSGQQISTRVLLVSFSICRSSIPVINTPIMEITTSTVKCRHLQTGAWRRKQTFCRRHIKCNLFTKMLQTYGCMTQRKTLVQIMICRRSHDKSLPEPMMRQFRNTRILSGTWRQFNPYTADMAYITYPHHLVFFMR